MRRNFISLYFAVLSLLLSIGLHAQTASAPWPMFHHDLQHTGVSPFTGPATAAQKWGFATGSFIGSSPAVGADGTIYIGSEDKKLYALNPDGTQKWAFITGGSINSSPTLGADGTVYVGSGDNKLYAVNQDGTQKWAFTTGNPIDAPPMLGADGTVYVGNDDFKLYAVKPDGTQKWAFTTGSNGIGSSPALGADGTIYIGSDKLYAINPNGTQKWAFTTGATVSGSSPVLGADGTVYVGCDDNKLYAINPDGTQKWAFMTQNWLYSSPALGTDGTVYIGSRDAKLYAVKSDGTQKWVFTTGARIDSSPALGADGTVYIGSFDQKLYAINSDGTQKWAFTTGDKIESSPALGADGTVYIGSLDGKLYAIGAHPLAVPKLLAPADKATNIAISPNLQWNTVASATVYEAEVATDAGFTAVVTDAKALTATSDAPKLTANTQYYWRVRAGDGTNWSAYSAPWSFTTVPGLAAPTLLAPADKATKIAISPTLTWSAVASATVYEAEVATDAGFTAVITDDKTLTATSDAPKLTANTQYYWRVRAGDGTNWSAYSAPWSFTTAATAPTLTAPTLTTPADAAINVALPATLTWGAVTGATVYGLQVATDAAFTAIIADHPGLTATSMSPALVAATHYYWHVRAGDGTSWSAYSAAWSFTTATAVQAMPAPSPMSPANGAVNTAVHLPFAWIAVASATVFEVQVATDAGFTTGLITTDSTTGSVWETLSAGTKYYWHVKQGNGTIWSSYSPVWSFTTAAAAATAGLDLTIRVGMTGDEVGLGVIDLTGNQSAWQDVADSTPATYFLTLHNTGAAPARMVIGSKATMSTGWMLHIFTPDGLDFYRNFLSQGWTTPTIPAGGSYTYRLEVTPDSGITDGAVQNVLVTAHIVGNTSAADAVQANTTKLGAR